MRMRICRPAVRVSGLLDLPARALHLVVSFLGTLDRAAACLTCRALRDAAKNGHQHVTFELTGWYIAKARASPHVLRSLHTFQSLLNRLDEEHQREGVDHASISKMIVYEHTCWWLQSQQLVSVAPEVVSFTIKASWEGMEHGTALLYKLHVLLAKMQMPS
jgi:hypothetical protein